MKPTDIQGLLAKSYEKELSDFGDFQVDKSLSGGKAQVYYNPKTGQAVVVHRGSEGSKDWLVNDTGLLVGYRGKRFRHAQEIQDKAEKKYGASNVTTLGHSLGAKIAEEVGQNSKEIITLNKPTVDTKKVSDKQYDIRTGSDVVSGFSGIASSNNKTTIPSGYRDFISEHSTDVLSRLPDEPIGRGGRRPRRNPSPPDNRPTITRREIQMEQELEDELIRLGVRFQQMLNEPRANRIPLLTGMIDDYRRLNQIHGGLDDTLAILETALRNEREIQGGMMGGANIQEMYRQLIDNHADIQLEEDLYDYRDRLGHLIEKFNRYVESLGDDEAEPFNALLDAYESEYQDILEEIEAQETEEESEEDEEGNKENIKPSNTGGRINPPREPKVFSTYTAEEIEAMERAREAIRIQRAEEARMAQQLAQAFPRHGLLAIQNPADMERRAIRPRNIGAPRGGKTPIRPPSPPDNRATTTRAERQAEAERLRQIHNFLLGEINRIKDYTYYQIMLPNNVTVQIKMERLYELSVYIDGLIAEYGMAEMFNGIVAGIEDLLSIYQTGGSPSLEPVSDRVTEIVEIENQEGMDGGRKTRGQMTPATLARLEARLATQIPLEPIQYDSETVEEFVAQLPPYLIELSVPQQRQFIADMVKKYYEEQKRLLAEFEAEMEAMNGAGRVDCYSQCHDCGCDSYRDFNLLHAM